MSIMAVSIRCNPMAPVLSPYTDAGSSELVDGTRIEGGVLTAQLSPVELHNLLLFQIAFDKSDYHKLFCMF